MLQDVHRTFVHTTLFGFDLVVQSDVHPPLACVFKLHGASFSGLCYDMRVDISDDGNALACLSPPCSWFPRVLSCFGLDLLLPALLCLALVGDFRTRGEDDFGSDGDQPATHNW